MRIFQTSCGRMIRFSPVIRTLAVSALALVLGAMRLNAGPHGSGTSPQKVRQGGVEPAAQATARVAGLTVPIDSKTGRLKALTASETAQLKTALEKLMNRSTQGLHVVAHVNGTQGIDLQGRFQHVVMIRQNPDGTSETGCFTDPDAAMAFLQGKDSGSPMAKE